ncbi:MAG: DUF4320 family protein [Angelakisella sp.]
MRQLITFLHTKRGDSNMISMIFVVIILTTLIVGGIVLNGEMAKLDDLQQIAQLMAREVALQGELNSSVNSRLSELESLYNLEVGMDVSGDFIGGGNKLKLESSFVVSITYETSYGVGGFINFRKEGIYVRKASGIVEEYHK